VLAPGVAARDRGRFITFEGGEGAGKSTQARHLAEALRAAGIEALLTREPGGSAGAEQIRALLVQGEAARWDAVTETLLHYAARRDHVETTIRPALDAGRWVVSDRFADSTAAYQGYGHGVPLERIRALHSWTVGGLEPDLTFVLDLPHEAGLGRTAGRAGPEDRYERMGQEFHARLRDGFLAIARAEPERCLLIDATQDVAAVTAAIRQGLRQRLGVTLA
jgi:dTMP kinase